MWITYQNIRFACHLCYYMTFVPFAQLQVTRRLYHLCNCYLRDWYNCVTYGSRISYTPSQFQYRYHFFSFLLTLYCFAINGITIEPWLQLFLTANLTGVGNLRLQPRIFNLYCGLQLRPTHLSVEIVTFFTTAKLLLNNVLDCTVIQH